MDYGINNNTLADITTQTTRAFTGHEQIAELPGLIHMNARLYDSEIGRFLSADTIIQDPHDSQAYNRYSYVRNNPLVYTDPSGHSWFSKLWKKIKRHIATIVAIVVVVVVTIYAPELLIKAFGTVLADGTTVSAFGVIGTGSTGVALTTLGGATVGAIAGFSAGFFGSLAGGASLGDAVELGLKAAFAGALTGGIGAHYGNTWNLERVAMHGLGGGAGSEVMGGSFKDGFKLSAALALVTWGAMEMRKYEIASSKKYSYDINGKRFYPNASGKSVGFRGDGFKLGGGRVPSGFKGNMKALNRLYRSPLGGVQGGLGQIKGLGDYLPGSFYDHVVEAFAGPHDFLNHGYWYDALGNAKQLTGFAGLFGEALNYTNVLIASPIVASSVIQPYDYLIGFERSIR